MKDWASSQPVSKQVEGGGGGGGGGGHRRMSGMEGVEDLLWVPCT